MALNPASCVDASSIVDSRLIVRSTNSNALASLSVQSAAAAAGPVVQCSDHPMDGLMNELGAFVDNDGWIRSNVQLPGLPKMHQKSFERLTLLLELPRPIKINLPDQTLTIIITLKEIFDVLKTKNQLSGGYLKFLLSSCWYREALSLLAGENNVRKWVGEAGFEWFDIPPLDVDFRHIVNNGSSPDVIAESVVELIASKIPKGSLAYSHHDLCNFIRRKGGAFEDFDRLFTIEDGDVQTDAFLLGLDGGDGPAVDLLIANKLENAALSTTQDFWIDLDDPAVVKGCQAEGWQSVLDASCKVLHLKRMTPKAFAAALSAMVKQYRCPEALSPKLFDNLRGYCSKSKFPSSRTLAKLLKSELQKHHKNPAKAGIALTYMASTYLLRNGFRREDISQLWQCMSQSLHPHDKLIIGNPVESSPLHAVHSAAGMLPFDLVDALLQIQQFSRLNRTRDLKDQNNGVFLRVNEKQYTMMALLEGDALILPCNPQAALETVLWYLEQSPLMLEAPKREMVLKFIRGLTKNQDYIFSCSSPVKANLEHMALNIPYMLQSAHKLLACPDPELKKMGYQLAVDCYGMQPSSETLEMLLSYLPDIMETEAGNSNLKALLDYLDEQIARRGTLSAAISGVACHHLQGLDGQKNSQEDVYTKCIKRMIDSSDELLCKIAYRILLRRNRSLHPEKKAKSMIRFACLLLEKNPTYALQVICKHINQCDFDPNELHLFIKRYVASALTCPGVSEDVKPLASLIKSVVQKHPLLNKALAPMMLQKCRDLMEAQPSYGYELMRSLVKESSLFAHCDELPGLWIQYCETFFMRAESDPLTLMRQWKEAEALKLWSTKKVFQTHRAFLVDFARKLYSLNNLEADVLGHSLVDILENHPKDQHSEAIRELAALRSTKKLGENRSREELELNIKNFMASLSEGVNASRRAETQDAARSLLERLCILHPDRSVCSANLAKARTLLENPFFQKLFDDKPADLQSMLIACLKTYISLFKHPDERNKIYSLIVHLLRITFAGMEPAARLPAILLLQQYAEIPEFELRGHLKESLERFLTPIFATMDLHGMHAKILDLLIKVASENRIMDANLPQISDIVLRALNVELKFFVEPLKSTDALSDTSSNNGESKIPGWHHKEQLKFNERYRNLFQGLSFALNMPVLANIEHGRCLNFCAAVLESLLSLESNDEVRPWTLKMMDLMPHNPGDAPAHFQFILFEAATALAAAGHYSESMNAYKTLYNRYAGVHDDIWYALLRNPETLAKAAPRKYAKLFLHTWPKDINPLFNERCSTAVKTILGRVVRADSTTKDLDIALKFYEVWPGTLQFPFRPLLARIQSGKDIGMKRRANKLLPYRASISHETNQYHVDPGKRQDWIDCWKPGLQLLNDLWHTTHEDQYKTDLLSILADLLNIDSSLADCFRDISAKELRESSLEFLVPMSSELCGDLKEHESILKGLVELKQVLALVNNEKLRLSVNEVLLSSSLRSPSSEDYLLACLSMKDIVQVHKQHLSGKPVALFVNLLRNVPLALGEHYYSIQLILSDILNEFKKPVLNSEEIISIAEALQRHQYDMAGASLWIKTAKYDPTIPQSFKARQDALHVRESSSMTMLKFGRFLIALGACSYVFNKLKTQTVAPTDIAMVVLLALLLGEVFRQAEKLKKNNSE